MKRGIDFRWPWWHNLTVAVAMEFAVKCRVRAADDSYQKDSFG